MGAEKGPGGAPGTGAPAPGLNTAPGPGTGAPAPGAAAGLRVMTRSGPSSSISRMRLVPVRIAEVCAWPLTSMLRPSAHWARHPSAVGRTIR